MNRIKHFVRRMKYLAWVEWRRIVLEDKTLSIPGIYLISQRELTKDEYDFPSTPEFQERLDELVRDGTIDELIDAQ